MKLNKNVQNKLKHIYLTKSSSTIAKFMDGNLNCRIVSNVKQ